LAAARLILASASPRRAQILEALGVPFTVEPANVDERLHDGEDPARATERLARVKAEAVGGGDGRAVLGADTLVVCDGRALGKPASPREAAEMLRALSGRAHDVVTGVCLLSNGSARSGCERTVVTFAPLSDAEIAWYVATGEPLDKAGAYHIDGRGGLFVSSVSGSPSNVAGLPVGLLRRLFGEAGLSLGPG
jgi:septum formation protein